MTDRPASPPTPDSAPPSFVDWFEANYPSGCTILNPLWHAERIYRAISSPVLGMDTAVEQSIGILSLSEDRNWPEDYAEENGEYLNRCRECKRDFVGHKRRLICKLCAARSPLQSGAGSVATTHETRSQIIERVIRAGGSYRDAWKEIRRVWDGTQETDTVESRRDRNRLWAEAYDEGFEEGYSEGHQAALDSPTTQLGQGWVSRVTSEDAPDVSVIGAGSVGEEPEVVGVDYAALEPIPLMTRYENLALRFGSGEHIVYEGMRLYRREIMRRLQLASPSPLVSPDSPDIRGLLNKYESEACRQALTDFSGRSEALVNARASVESAFSVLREQRDAIDNERLDFAERSMKAEAEVAGLREERDDARQEMETLALAVRVADEELRELRENAESDITQGVEDAGEIGRLRAEVTVLREEVERRFQEAMESHKANAELAQLLFDKDAEIEMLRENILSVRDRYSAEFRRLQAEQLTTKYELHECGWLLREPLDFNSRGDQEKVREARTRIAKLHNDLARSLYTERQP